MKDSQKLHVLSFQLFCKSKIISKKIFSKRRGKCFVPPPSLPIAGLQLMMIAGAPAAIMTHEATLRSHCRLKSCPEGGRAER